MDFRSLGLFFPNKEYNSAKEAAQSLQSNRNRVNALLESARDKQITNFRSCVGSVVKSERDICIMPYVRINPTKSSSQRSQLEFAEPGMKRVPIAKYLSTHRKETNLHQSDIKSSTVTTGIFEPASAHHPFNKNATQIKKIYTSIFENARRKSRYVSSEIPVAVTTGAERVAAFAELAAPMTILNNTPMNVQR